jgi:hypothetical protein
MSEQKSERSKARELKKLEEKAKKKKRALLRILIPVSLGVAIAIVELILYYRVSAPDVEPFIPSRNPPAFLVVVDQAIQEYSTDHGGTMPNRLEDLLGRYLPPERITPADLETLDYVRNSPQSYTLKLKTGGSDLMPGFTLSEKGFETGG